ncbi:MAG: CHC2 zinc finger domain-containing protein [Candidatus Eremiobacterota bacterium]
MHRDELDALKARVDLAGVFRTAGVELKRSGQSLVGRCPFHPDEKPSLSVTPEKGLWQCFGCQAGGDVLELLQRLENLEFPEAVKRVQELAGVREPARKARKPAPEPVRDRELLGRVADLYHEALLKCPRAQDYLKQRGLGDRELWSAFRLGYADGSLKDRFPARGEVAAALAGLGVVSQGRELMRGCVVVPLGHPSGQTLGLYGRAIQEGSRVPHRYLCGPKRGVLNWQALRSCSRLVVAESVLDALSLWQAGVREVTCLYGAGGLPPDLKALLEESSVREVVWCLDADAAGREATARLAAQLQAQGRSSFRVPLPEGTDPNRVLTGQGPEALAGWVRQAHPLQAATSEASSEAGPGALEASTRSSTSEPDPVPARAAVPTAPASVSGTPDPAPARAHPAVLPFTPAPRPVASASLPVAGPADLDPEPEPLEKDRFRLRLEDVTYEVALLAPFHGRLKVLLRAERAGQRFSSRLDFWVSRSVSQEAAQLARRLDLSKEQVEQHLARLQAHAEEYVALHQRSSQALPPAPTVPRMTAREREEALEFLRRPDLVEQILRDLEALGYVGEEANKLLAYLIGISRKLEEPLAGIILSQSSAGKSGLTDLIEQLTPEEEVVLYSRITAQAISHHEKEALVRKLLILAEKAGGGESADYQIRELLSRHKFKTAVPEKDMATGQIVTRLKEVEGPVSYLETTANPSQVHPENATRCFELELDESEEQTRRIHRAQKARYKLDTRLGRDHLAVLRRRHHNAQRLLEVVAVLIPYVDHIRFPARWVRTRRDHKRFLCLIEAAAFLHQFQRSGGTLPDGTRYIEATLADYRLAWRLAREVLRSTFHELTRGARDLWEALSGWVRQQAGGGRVQDVLFTRRTARHLVNWPRHRVEEAVQELVDMEYLFVASGSQGKAFHYHVLADSTAAPCPLGDLTPPEELERLGVT